MTPTINLLKKAKELISDRTRWTKGSAARTLEGIGVNALSESAVCWCTTGAVSKASGLSDGLEGLNMRVSAIAALDKTAIEDERLKGHAFPDSIRFNDAFAHSDVMDLFDKTIKRLESQVTQ